MIGGALTLFGGRIECLGSSALACTCGGGNGVGRTANFIWSGNSCTFRTDTLENFEVKDHAFGATSQLTGLLVRECFGLSEYDECD